MKDLPSSDYDSDVSMNVSQDPEADLHDEDHALGSFDTADDTEKNTEEEDAISESTNEEQIPDFFEAAGHGGVIIEEGYIDPVEYTNLEDEEEEEEDREEEEEDEGEDLYYAYPPQPEPAWKIWA